MSRFCTLSLARLRLSVGNDLTALGFPTKLLVCRCFFVQSKLCAAILAERVRHQQEKMIEFLHKELEVLREQMGDKRILLTDDQRRVLAVKGMALDKEQLERTCIIVQPDTLRRWHRELVEGNRYKSGQREIGRPSTDHEIVELVLRMARENAGWGYTRIEAR